MAKVDTVQIAGPKGPVTINASDFDSSKHKLFAKTGAADPVKAKAEADAVAKIKAAAEAKAKAEAEAKARAEREAKANAQR